MGRPQVTATGPSRTAPPPTPPPLPTAKGASQGSRTPEKGVKMILSKDASSNPSHLTGQTVASDRKTKRTYADYDSSEEVAYIKKQRTRNLELHPKSGTDLIIFTMSIFIIGRFHYLCCI